MPFFRRRKRAEAERVLLRHPVDRTEQGVASIVVALAPPLGLLFLGRSLFGYQMAVSHFLLWAAVFLALGALLIWRSRWRVLVTTRRLLLRPGWMRREIVEIPVVAIQTAHHDAASRQLVVTSGGVDYGIWCSPATAKAVLDALREAGAPPA